jgi:FtsP/CotA-like multicopper oxidase with cupredoxin domain
LRLRFSTASHAIAAACLGIFLGISFAIFLVGFFGLSLTARLAAAIPDAPPAQQDVCVRPEPGSAVSEPADLRSRDGVLLVDLTLRDAPQPRGGVRYCYLTPEGAASPTLRVKPGDQLILRFRNRLDELATNLPDARAQEAAFTFPICKVPRPTEACASGTVTAVSTNLHFHGMTVPPVCHGDDVLNTSIQPGNEPYEYRLQIPPDAAPGLYWYHPHVHGFSSTQMQGGASGALIVEGIEQAVPEVAGLAERVLVIRDQALLNPDALPSKSEPIVPKNLVDNDGDAANNGTGFGKPARDLSINFVAVPYPDYPPARLEMKPGERQLWRVVNASAITYLNLALIFGHAPQRLGLVAIDGVPLHFNGSPSAPVQWVDHLGVPPGGRVEFIVTGPPLGVPALLVTRTVDTGPGGENDPNRALASIVAAADAAEPRSMLPAEPVALPAAARPWVGSVPPVRVRRLYFSEELQDPNDPNSPTTFYLTVEGQARKPFDPSSDLPDIVVNQGDVEDWIIENRSNELHDFHIHQLHFELVAWDGRPVNEPFLRDTVNVPYYKNRMLTYPSVRLRMDFRDPNIVGTFAYHCHLLEHEDGGMMGRIEVKPAKKTVSTNLSTAPKEGTPNVVQ